MNVLIVLAHPEPKGKSFNHAMVGVAEDALRGDPPEAMIFFVILSATEPMVCFRWFSLVGLTRAHRNIAGASPAWP